MEAGAIDALGFLAAALTLATFAQRAMIPMRITAIAANICFILYGAYGSYMPVLALHVVLLPLNIIRLRPLLLPAPDSAPESRLRSPEAGATKPAR